MYYMYLDRMEIPIPPAEMTTTIAGKNETIDLIGKGEVNIIKPPGLTEVSFKFMLPNSNYPFNQSTLFKGRKAKYYLDELDRDLHSFPTRRSSDLLKIRQTKGSTCMRP